MNKQEQLFMDMIEYYSGDTKRIQHFIKVHGYAQLIGKAENLQEETLNLLETSAIVHDIGIKNAYIKFGNSNGKLQEQEGPIVAKEMMEKIGYDKDVIERVCYLVAHHHTYTDVDGLDYRILLEADFLVNLQEGEANREKIDSALENIFKTECGTKICKTMFSSVK